MKEYGDRQGDDMFDLCGNNDEQMRCEECKKQRPDIFEVARKYVTYEEGTERCPLQWNGHNEHYHYV